MSPRKFSDRFFDRFFNLYLWIRFVGLKFLIPILVIGALGFGMYKLAVAGPIVKLSITLVGIALYNLMGFIIRRLPRNTLENNKKVQNSLGCLLASLIPVASFSLILSALILPWFISVFILLDIIFAVAITTANKKRVAIPTVVFWIRNINIIIAFASLAYFWAKLIGWL